MKKVLVLDFGSQYTALLVKLVRSYGVYVESVEPSVSSKELQKENIWAIILSGGPASVNKKEAPVFDENILTLGIPILGICYGHQLICTLLGGGVSIGQKSEYGRAELSIKEQSPLFYDLPEKRFSVWMSHGDTVEKTPRHFEILADTPDCRAAVVGDVGNKIYGMQFHPEVSHSENGSILIHNFLFRVANCEQNMDLEELSKEYIDNIREQIQDGEVLCGVSGGVDSTVAAALVHKAIGKRLHSVFVDTGLLRYEEKEYVAKVFESLGIKLSIIDASRIFLSKLGGIIDPELKRKIIGNTFVEVFEGHVKSKLSGVKFLVQGTLYSDVIESSGSSSNSKLIKSHHNVGGLPEKMDLKIVEPLNRLFKDEVRKLGLTLGISKEVLFRHPFPGPGLAIRIMGEVTREKLDILAQSDQIYLSMLKEHNLYDKIWQAFAILTNTQTVGIVGDNRTYEYVLALRAVNSSDGMTADFYHMPYEFLSLVSRKICNSVKGVGRVVLDITSKPPATIEWE